jgi:SAM-dependent methyltransferase
MPRELLRRAGQAFAMLQPGALAAWPFRCPSCGPSVLVRIAPNAIGVRCLRCAASAATLSLIAVLQSARPRFAAEAVYELSARGPFVDFLRRCVPRLTCSEFFDDVPRGERRDGVLCQDVQQLTFTDASFDVVTSTEVFEHVADDARGFSEVRRVLRPGGVFIFTVPLADAEATVERACLRNGEIEHLLPPEYHGDRIRGRNRVLAFRNYGRDITRRLQSCGFSAAHIDARCATAFLGHGSGVIVARA